MKDIFIHDIIEENGLTVRENNLNIPYKFSVRDLVETVEIGSGCSTGLRAYVVERLRDFDGEPMCRCGNCLQDDAIQYIFEHYENLDDKWFVINQEAPWLWNERFLRLVKKN